MKIETHMTSFNKKENEIETSYLLQRAISGLVVEWGEKKRMKNGLKQCI